MDFPDAFRVWSIAERFGRGKLLIHGGRRRRVKSAMEAGLHAAKGTRIRVRYTDFILSKEEANEPSGRGGSPAIAAVLRAVGAVASCEMGVDVELVWEPSPFEQSSGPDTEETAMQVFGGDPLYIARL